jgi:hypothetical protein
LTVLAGEASVVEALRLAVIPTKPKRGSTMCTQRSDQCIDPCIGRLLEEALAEELVKPGREKDLVKFEEHSRICKHCWAALIEHGNREVVLPFLNENPPKE